MKTTNSRKEVNESELGSLHEASLDLTSDVPWHVWSKSSDIDQGTDSQETFVYEMARSIGHDY